MITIILTLTTYSLIAFITYLINHERDEILVWFGAGVVGWVLVCIRWIIQYIRKIIKYHKIKSIIQCPDGDLKWCECKDANDIYFWHTGYKLEKRCAEKNEWGQLSTFSKDEISRFKNHCDNCVYKECSDMYGDIDESTCKCLLPKEQWEDQWSPKIDENYPCFKNSKSHKNTIWCYEITKGVI